MIHQGHKYKLGAQNVIALESADKGHVKVAEIVLPWLGQSKLVRVDSLKPMPMKYFGGAYE